MNRLTPLLLPLMLAGQAQAGVSALEERYREAGDIIMVGIPVVALGASLLAGNHRRNQAKLIGDSPWSLSPTAELSFSLAFSAAMTQSLKRATNQRRPNGTGLSFPSGHTSAAFTGAEFIREQYGWGWGVPAYLAAGFVGYSRVASQRHYGRDVLAGAVIGIASNHIGFWNRTDGQLRITPLVSAGDPGLFGFAINFRF